MTALRQTFFRVFQAEGLPSTFWLLWGGAFINRLGGFVVPFLALYLTQQRGVTAAQVGVVLSLYGLGSVLAGLVGGWSADRFGRRATLGVTLLLAALAMLQLATARSTAHIAASTFALGFFGEMYRPALQAAVADLVPGSAQRMSAFGLLYWAANFGFAVSTALAGLLSRHGFAVLFVGNAATTLCFAAIVLTRIPETRPAPEGKAERPDLIAPLRDRTFVAHLLASLLLIVCFYQVNSTLPLAMAHDGLSNGDFGLLVALNGVLIVALQPLASRVARRARRGSLLAASALLIGLGFGSHALASGHASWAAGIVVWTLGEILLSPVQSTVIADLAPARLRGSYQGAWMLTHGVAAFLGPLGGGWLLEHAGPSTLWLFCGGAAALAALGHLRNGARLDASPTR